MIVFSRDSLRSAVEAATGGRITVLYDDKGLPSYMAVIPRFRYEDVGLDQLFGTGTLEAFVKGGVEVPEIFIAQYEADIVDGRAISLPGRFPSTAEFDAARAACTAKGPGWHLMTVHEWAALAMQAVASGMAPRGNDNVGGSSMAVWERGYKGSTGSGLIATGSGPAAWRLPSDFSGISDLVGNADEWLDGLKLVDGQILTLPANDFDTPEASWVAQPAFFDSPVAGAASGSGGSDLGAPTLAAAVTNFVGTPGNNDSASTDFNRANPWSTMQLAADYAPIQLLQRLFIEPNGSASYPLPTGGVAVRNVGERMLRRGGSSASFGSLYLPAAGLYALDLLWDRMSIAGFRCAFIP